MGYNCLKVFANTYQNESIYGVFNLSKVTIFFSCHGIFLKLKGILRSHSDFSPFNKKIFPDLISYKSERRLFG